MRGGPLYTHRPAPIRYRYPPSSSRSSRNIFRNNSPENSLQFGMETIATYTDTAIPAILVPSKPNCFIKTGHL